MSEVDSSYSSVIFISSSLLFCLLKERFHNQQQKSQKGQKDNDNNNSDATHTPLSTRSQGRLSYAQLAPRVSEEDDVEYINDSPSFKQRWGTKRFNHHFDLDHDFTSSSHYDGIRRPYARSFSAPSNSTIISSNNKSDIRYEQPRKNVTGDAVANIDEQISKLSFRPLVRHGSLEDNKQKKNRNDKHILPQKLIFIRHGQSEGNVNEEIYSRYPDSDIRLTKLGFEQARRAGEILKNQILSKGKDSKVHFIVSPYVRTMETFHGLVSAWCDPKEFDNVEDEDERLKLWYGRLAKVGVTFNEDPRIREQDFGNYQDKDTIEKAKRERFKFGIFYYRFPNGESASDVFDRMSTFLDSLWRIFSNHDSQNYVLVTHGISIRVLLARYYRYSIDQFNLLVSFYRDNHIFFDIVTALLNENNLSIILVYSHENSQIQVIVRW